MKRIWMAAALALCLCLAACGFGTAQDGLSRLCEASGLALGDAEILSDEDSHGGFHGDGTRLAVAKWEEAPDRTRWEAAGWRELPLDKTAAGIFYGTAETVEGPDGPRIGWGPLLTGADGETPAVPDVAHGCWYFLDRHSDREGDFWSRSSFNFTIALFDSDTNTLYYGEVDT